MKRMFTYEVTPEPIVRAKIRECEEAHHVQQVIFSTYHDLLTQICFTEQIIRSGLEWEGTEARRMFT